MKARPRRGRWVVLGVLLGLLAIGGLAAFRLLGISRDLATARDLIQQAGASIEAGEVRAARERLDRAQALLLEANNQLASSMELQVARAFPVASENLEAIESAVQVAYSLVAGGNSLLTTAAPLEAEDGTLEVSLVEGRIPLELVEDAARRASSLASGLPTESTRPSTRWLVGPVRQLQDTVYDEAILRRGQLGDLAQGLGLLAEMAGGSGPRRYLLAVANTAEMRGTGGMILTYGVLESSEGEFSLPAFGPIDELFLDTAISESRSLLAADEAARWAGLEPSRLWRNANLVPDFQVVGPRLEAMYEEATGLSADGVIQIDAHGLAAILEGIGPVIVPGLGRVDATNVVDLTLNQVYARFPDDQDQRREVLGEVAEVVFDRLVDGEYESLRPLATALVDAAAERHIVMYGATSDAARPLAYFLADGALPPLEVSHAMFATFQNFGRDKLDYYLDTSVAVTGSRLANQRGELEIVVTVANGAPPGQTEPLYVFGDPITGRSAPTGTYLGTASVYVPSGTVLEGSSGDAGAELGTEADRTVIGIPFEVPAGEERSVTLRVTLPARPDATSFLLLVPSPRIRPTVWFVDIETGAGRLRRTGPLERVELLRESPG